MQIFAGIERRNLRIERLDLFVEIGVNYNRTIGAALARGFLGERGVPQDVIARVTSPSGRRRLTRWELHVDEPGLRRALGARPLLAEFMPSVKYSA